MGRRLCLSVKPRAKEGVLLCGVGERDFVFLLVFVGQWRRGEQTTAVVLVLSIENGASNLCHNLSSRTKFATQTTKNCNSAQFKGKTVNLKCIYDGTGV